MSHFVISVKEAIEIEKKVIESGVSEESLMEKAGQRIFEAFLRLYPDPCQVIVYLGKGNNAGDALVLARYLKQSGYAVELRAIHNSEEELKELSRLEWNRFQEEVGFNTPLKNQIVLVDGLLGLFSHGAPRPDVQEKIQEINKVKKLLKAEVVSIDFPTGIDPEGQQGSWDVVEADYTFTVGFVKDVLLGRSLENNVGKIVLIPVDEFSESCQNKKFLYSHLNLVKSIFQKRKFNSHKYSIGQTILLAGSPSYWGAARMSSYAAVRAGAGLTTLYVPKENYNFLLSAFHPEIILKPFEKIEEIPLEKVNSLVVGPGAGVKRCAEWISYLSELEIPQVWDADMITALSQHSEKNKILKKIKHVILTPHQGEFKRLFPTWQGEPLSALKLFQENCSGALLFKSCRMYVAAQEKNNFYVNSTGNAGLAKGGSGDVLAGTLGALLAQGYSLAQAGVLAAWIVGAAADFSVSDQSQSVETLMATDLVNKFPVVFQQLAEAFEL